MQAIAHLSFASHRPPFGAVDLAIRRKENLAGSRALRWRHRRPRARDRARRRLRCGSSSTACATSASASRATSSRRCSSAPASSTAAGARRAKSRVNTSSRACPSSAPRSSATRVPPRVRLPRRPRRGLRRYPSRDPNAYALRVKGDSMRPRIKPGEFVLVEPNTPPQPGRRGARAHQGRPRDGQGARLQARRHRAALIDQRRATARSRSRSRRSSSCTSSRRS
jgi:hypothetical protein